MTTFLNVLSLLSAWASPQAANSVCNFTANIFHKIFLDLHQHGQYEKNVDTNKTKKSAQMPMYREYRAKTCNAWVYLILPQTATPW